MLGGVFNEPSQQQQGPPAPAQQAGDGGGMFSRFMKYQKRGANTPIGQDVDMS